MNPRYARLLLAFAISVGVQIILSALFSFTDQEGSMAWLNRLSVLLGGNFVNGGYIQFLTFFCFFWGVLEVRQIIKSIKVESKYINTDLLPRGEHEILGVQQVNSIRVSVLQYMENKRNLDTPLYYLNLIKKACTKFRANHSADAAFTIVTAQSRLNRDRSESEQSHIRYIAWAIPSIGFIGTVLGISQALGLANTNDIDLITATLGIAFDTTLLALILSVILMWMIHDMQEKTEQMHVMFEEEVTDNLINKIDVS